MKHKRSFGFHIRTVSCFLMICCIFYVSAREDQKYKNWKREYLGLYQSYIDVEYYCHISYQINEKIIIDLSDLKGMYIPFDHKILGTARRFLYQRLAPKIIKARKLVKRSDADFRVVCRNRQYGFQPSFKPSAADIEKIDMRDLIQVRSFMIKHGVRIIILPYYKAGWTELINLMKSKGFKYVYGNTYYILFFLTEVDDIA